MVEKQGRNTEYFCKQIDEMKKKQLSNKEMKTTFLGLIAGFLAVIADALESKVGDTNGNS